MSKAPKQPNQVDKEHLDKLVKAREQSESKEYNNANCESNIHYTGANKAEVTFWIDGAPNKAFYELNSKGSWYCYHDWRD